MKSIEAGISYIMNFIKHEKHKFRTVNQVPSIYNEIIKKDLPAVIVEWVIKSGRNQNDYIVKGGTGQGYLSEIPYVFISKREISTSAERGVYLVLLFDRIGENCYLSLNQGWTEIKGYCLDISNDKKQSPALFALKQSEYYRKKIKSESISENAENIRYIERIDLHSRTPLGKGYEYTNIIAVKFNVDNLCHFWKSLDNLLSAYEDISRYHLNNDEHLKSFLVNTSLDFETGELYRAGKEAIEKTYETINEDSIIGIDNEAKTRKGKLGEAIVYAQFKSALPDCELIDTSNLKIGYDMEIQRGECRIGLEIKNITSENSTHFYLSEYEIHQMKIERSRLVLYDSGNTYISRALNDTKYIKELVNYYEREYKLNKEKWEQLPFVIETNGIKVSFHEKKFYDDFVVLKEKSQKELLRFLDLPISK